ncbi:thymidine phosphorylase family protein [Ketobacter alkanivorans]|uniref:Putative thymidine phosphorylase n=1 Tax=Ketobacter alkanivorans TaxID=1917421 RepID=A0A2K9LG52_9GAMM|nr:thymidine phosphorylase family protein [Ketobacter alkanivorans]AUM11328.1 thymidine phosphorylase [Ketobacter alkanivorans]
MESTSQPILTLKRVAIDTYHENVAYLHRECPTYKVEGFQALSKIEIQQDGKHILAVLNVVDDERIVMPGQLGLSEQAFSNLGVSEGSNVKVNHAEPPQSMEFVREKLSGERITQEKFNQIIKDIASNRYSKPEIAAFIVAVSEAGLDRDEVLYLTNAMVSSGQRLDWEEKRVVDKHCIGGIPGNRTSMIVVPIVAAFGLLCPKTSSRAITSPAGTADTMEVLAQVDLPVNRLHQIVREQRGCLAWGGTAKLAPADDVLISVERPLAIDSQAQMVASIMSKKRACGSTHLLIDIPAGPTAKVRTMKEAMQLRKLFEYVGDRIGLETQVIITDGRQPIGRGIGPVLEAQDVMKVLRNDPDAPHDLREKSLQLAGRLIEFENDIRGGEGYDVARDILDSGRALFKMEQLIAAQGKQETVYTLGTQTQDVTAVKDGVVVEINNLTMARIARLAGAPMDKGAGVYLFKRIGDHVKQGEPLYRIYSEFSADFQFACNLANKDNGFRIGQSEELQFTW